MKAIVINVLKVCVHRDRKNIIGKWVSHLCALTDISDNYVSLMPLCLTNFQNSINPFRITFVKISELCHIIVIVSQESAFPTLESSSETDVSNKIAISSGR